MVRYWKTALKKCMIIPQRYILGIMGSLAVLNAYTMRNCLSVAITEMVVYKNGKSKSTAPDSSELYDWDEVTQGLILGAFYWGYVITHIPGGILAEKYGGKYALSLGILSTALFTLITPTVIRIGDWPGLMVLRILEGLGEGTTFPALNALLSKWVPLNERGKIGSLVYSGAQIGTVVANFGSGFIIEATGTWSSPFYLFGGLGILWFIIFTGLCYSTPLDHPFISDKELAFLDKELSGLDKEKAPIPWVAILSSAPVWAMVVAHVGHDWCFFTMVTDLPKYMKDALDFTVSQNGLWSSLPYFLMWMVSMGSGFLVDWLITKEYFGVTFARKLFTTIGAVVPGIFIIAASYAGTDQVLVIMFFTLAMGSMGCFYAGLRVNALDITTNFGGTVMALENGIGAVSGIVTPYLIGVIISREGDRLLNWRIVFWITLVVVVVTSIVYVIYASGDVQLWDTPKLYYENRAAVKADKEAAKAERKSENAERALGEATFKAEKNAFKMAYKTVAADK